MQRKRLIKVLVIVTAIAIFCGVVVWWWPPVVKEPEFQGKRLSEWLKEYNSTIRPEESKKAKEAVIKIGTNSIPTLLAMARSNDSRLRAKVINLLRSRRIFFKGQYSAVEYNYFALLGFGMLKGEAREAVQSLIEIMEHGPSAESRQYAASDLGAIGASASNAIPALLKYATNRNDIQGATTSALAAIGQRPALVVPAMTASLNNSNFDGLAHFYVILALSRFGPQAQQAVPALIQKLSAPDGRVQVEAARALGEIGPGASNAVPVLWACATNSTNFAAIVAITKIRPDPELEAAAYVRFLNDTNSRIDLRTSAAFALGAYGSESQVVVPALMDSLAHSHIDETNRPFRYSVMKALGQIGPSASNAVPMLLTVATNRNDRQDAAQDALKRISPRALLGAAHTNSVKVVTPAQRR